mgnify:CR=1 FL=1
MFTTFHNHTSINHCLHVTPISTGQRQSILIYITLLYIDELHLPPYTTALHNVVLTETENINTEFYTLTYFGHSLNNQHFPKFQHGHLMHVCRSTSALPKINLLYI